MYENTSLVAEHCSLSCIQSMQRESVSFDLFKPQTYLQVHGLHQWLELQLVYFANTVEKNF